MGIRWLSFAAAAFLLSISSLRGQNQVNCDRQNCTFTLSFDDPLNGPPPVIVGAPYAGQESRQQARTLPNGTHTNIQYSGPLTYRDSKGRLRTEESVYRNQTSDRPAPPDNFTVIEIRDPVAGYQFILDPVNRVSHRMTYKPAAIEVWKTGPLTPAGPPTSNTTDGTTWTNEPLGTKTISGITTVGYRLTHTNPRAGGTQPFPVSDEHWNDPRTGVSLLSTNVDNNSVMTMSTLNYSAAEPDPALFQVPEGYKVVDETGPFQVVHTRAAGSSSGGSVSSGNDFGGLTTDSDGQVCNVTYTPAAGGAVPMRERAITGAPYSGRETFRRGPAATSTGRFAARDSAGRVRTDPAAMSGGRGGTACRQEMTPPGLGLVEILDPVAGYRYILDTVAHVAYRLPYQTSTQPYQPRMQAPNPGTRTLPNGVTVQDEDLGMQVISGVNATGHRTTQTYPPGTYMGNDKAVVQIAETWIDPQTGIRLVSKNSMPDGDTEISIPDYTTAPDPALFKIPDGYKIVDETGKFTFAIVR